MSNKSKICVFSYGEIGRKLLYYMCRHNKKIELVFLRKNDADLKEKIKICKKNNTRFEVIQAINDPKCVSFFESQDIELVFLLWWPDIIPKNIISQASSGIINLHPSFLPYNRGMHPYYWSIVDKTPAGVTIHFIDEKIDAGHIIAQEKIIGLFRKNYDNILEGNFLTKAVDIKQGTFHLKKDLDAHSEIILERKYKAEELLDIIRGRTFTSMPSSYFYKDGKKYHVRVEIEEAE